MSTTEQCRAPGSNGKRCKNLVIDNNKLHCSQHYTKAVKLYNDYKKICKSAEGYDMDNVKTLPSVSEKIKYLNKCYYIYTQIYDARMKHRDYAFIPEFYDYGHYLQFEIINKNINECEIHLQDLYTQFTEENKEQKDITMKEDNKKDKNEDNIEVIIKKVNIFKKKRIKDKKETERLIKKYTDENKEIEIQKIEAIDYCYNILIDLLPINKNFEYHQLVCIVNYLLSLESMGYFDNRFKLLKNRTKYEQFMYLPLDYPDIDKYPDIKQYLAAKPVMYIFDLTMSLIMNGKKFKEILKNFLPFWKNFTLDLLQSMIFITWDPKGDMKYDCHPISSIPKHALNSIAKQFKEKEI